MHRGLACSIILLLGAAPTASADTLAAVLRANGLSPPAGLPDVDRPIGSHVIAAETGPTIVLYDAGESGGSARLVALRLGPGIVRRVPLVWPRSAPEGLSHRRGPPVFRPDPVRTGTDRGVRAVARPGT